MKLICATILVCVPLLWGCAAQSNVDARARWTADRGGEVADQRLNRLESLGDSWRSRSNVGLRFHVLNSPQLAAYSWPDGDIFLSAGLMDAATDQQIAAVIAHELGHFIQNSGSNTMSLGGTSLQIEERADASAIELLRSADVPPASLISVLNLVRRASNSEQMQSEISKRIERIRAITAADQ